MKTLDFNQMEKIEGGGFWSSVGCGLATGFQGAILGAAIGGPVGFVAGLTWGALAGAACSMGAEM